MHIPGSGMWVYFCFPPSNVNTWEILLRYGVEFFYLEGQYLEIFYLKGQKDLRFMSKKYSKDHAGSE